MKKYDIHYPKYDLLVSKLSKGEALPELDIVEADERCAPVYLFSLQLEFL